MNRSSLKAWDIITHLKVTAVISEIFEIHVISVYSNEIFEIHVISVYSKNKDTLEAK